MMSMGVGRVEAFAGDADRRVDERDLPFGKLAVHGRTGHLDHLADYHSVGGCHKYPYSAAAAPLTTSMISLVMLLWRTRFI